MHVSTIMPLKDLLLIVFLCCSSVMRAQGTTAAPDSTIGVVTVQEQPCYKGGAARMYKFLKRTIRYPRTARKAGISGKVYVKFTVEKDGRVTEVHVAKGVDPLIDAEAVRAVSLMPPWEPGKLNGNPVVCRFTIPIIFRLP